MQRLITTIKSTGVLLVMITAMVAGALVTGTMSSAQAQEKNDLLKLQQIALTEAQITGYLKIGPKLNSMFDRIDKSGGQPDEKLSADLEALAKEGGFKSFEELETVVSNVTFVMSGINDEDGGFKEPIELLRQELEEIEKDKSIKAEEKKQLITSIKESIAQTPKLEHAGNVKLVKKHFAALVKLFEE